MLTSLKSSVIADEEIIALITRYLEEIHRDRFHRYSSWDNCRKAFSTAKRHEYHVLELAFYLASWGMYRGSSGLLQKNHLIHEKAVELYFSDQFSPLICTAQHDIEIKHIPLVLELKHELSQAYSSIKYIRSNQDERPISPTDTLVTKIMLGIFGCMPAFDQYLLSGFKEKQVKARTFDKVAIVAVFAFAELHQSTITICQDLIYKRTGNHYPIMKIIDIIFWQIGYDSEMEKARLKKSQNFSNI